MTSLGVTRCGWESGRRNRPGWSRCPRLASSRGSGAESRRAGTADINRERLIRALTFWLRPAFALRVVGRFQRIVGFDRSMALASSGLTALIPLVILCSAVFGYLGHPDIAGRIISRYGLSGGGADAVRQLFSSTTEASSSVSVVGAVFLTISVLSFTRAAQRLFEQTWELKPLSVRNTPNGLCWIAGLASYLAATGWIQSALGGGRLGLAAAVCVTPLCLAFLVWGGWILSAKRIAWQRLLPFGVLGAVLLAAYSVWTTVYLPHLFDSYATRYGAVGAVFTMISALFGGMLAVVGSAALGREVSDEFDRIRRGQRPSADEVRRQWDDVVGQMRSRWHTAQGQLGHRHDPGTGTGTDSGTGSGTPKQR